MTLMRTFRAATAVTLIFLASNAFAEDVPRVFQCDGKPLAAAKALYTAGDAATVEVVRAICNRADSMLHDGPFTVVNKTHPLPGVDPHEYVSLAPYFWPNPNTPDGLPYIRHDGERNPETQGYDSPILTRFCSHVYTLALAGYFTGDRKYSDRAALLIRAWFFDPATRMNPDLQHAQFVKGVNDGRGTGILETVRLLNVIDAIGFLQLSPSWTDDDQTKIHAWFSDYVHWMQTSDHGHAESNATNNHGSWFDVQNVAFMLFLGDEESARKIAETAKTKRIARQIEPNGQEPRELTRTKSFGYSTFNLSALTELADLSSRVDVDLWHYKTDDGRCIRATIDWLIPYALGEKKWTHQQISAMTGSAMFIPLRRAAVAYPDPKLGDISNRLHNREDEGLDDLRYPLPK
ncbi:MAG TPA: alginate lyase family protein [Tepidisphaeraceae bacterium]|nr:alginate lyase family protein [Tepidisphaeraceae bacterium]